MLARKNIRCLLPQAGSGCKKEGSISQILFKDIEQIVNACPSVLDMSDNGDVFSAVLLGKRTGSVHSFIGITRLAALYLYALYFVAVHTAEQCAFKRYAVGMLFGLGGGVLICRKHFAAKVVFYSVV